MRVFSVDETDSISLILDCCGGWSLSFESIGLNKNNHVGKVDWVEAIDFVYCELTIIVKRAV